MHEIKDKNVNTKFKTYKKSSSLFWLLDSRCLSLLEFKLLLFTLFLSFFLLLFAGKFELLLLAFVDLLLL